ncbi:nucleoside-diphosphate sugar epimerase/dehydratase [Gorillibacterium massiliense]|uniref:UDP-N-acetylglucosamine 4,6-dehydratase family protein n=1 Tax=Gorillibacterium massiliense TaxID=1280390 RepID=UPI00307B89F3
MEDILGRESVPIQLHEAAEFVQGKAILVTGAGGSIGSELCKQISGFHPEKIILLGHGENSIYNIESELKNKFPEIDVEAVIADIQDKKRLNDVFSHYRPKIIFHAAAHKHVPMMENNASEAVKNNIFGTRNVAQCAISYKAECFVFISSDKAVRSSSVMGATKRLAEFMLLNMGKSQATKFLIVRFGNVLGSRGSVVPLFKRQIEDGGPVTVTHPDMVRYFMTISEAVQLVLLAVTMAQGGEILILDMGKPVKILDLAHRLIRLTGLEPDKDIQIVYTGIRPGEKLAEQLFSPEEKINKTKHDFIFACEPAEFSNENLLTTISSLEKMVSSENTFDLSEKIRSVTGQFLAEYPIGTVSRRREDRPANE